MAWYPPLVYRKYPITQEPRYDIKKVKLSGIQPKSFELPFPCDFVAFIDVGTVDTSKVWVAVNTPQKFIRLDKAPILKAPVYVPPIQKLWFRWEATEEGKEIEVYFSGAPSIEVGVNIFTIGGDYVGLAKEATLSGIKTQIDKLQFDTNNYLLIAIADSKIMVPVDIQGDAVGLAKTADITDLKNALKPTRSTPTQDKSGVSIPASGVENIDKSNLDGYSAIVLTVKATYNANASNGLRVRWLYSPDGTNYDSPEDAEDAGNYEDLTFEKGKTRQRTIVIPILQPYMRIQLVNLDTGYAVTVDAWTTLLR